MIKLKLCVIVITLLAIGACKKDNSSAGKLTFTLNGTNRSFDIYTSTLTNYDTLGVQFKELDLASPGLISGPALTSGAIISLSQNLTLPGSNSFLTGAYADRLLDTSCNTAFTPGCAGFFFYYYDQAVLPTGGLETDHTDSIGVLNITAFSTSPNLVSGNFKCRVTDFNGNYYTVTNGLFTNVPFVVQ